MLTVPSPTAGLVRVASLARLEPALGASAIDRYGRQRQVVIVANLNGPALGDAVQEISAHLRGKNLPSVPVDDIQLHPREGDLVLATHGRGVFILDDASALVSLKGLVGQELQLVPIRTATEWRLYDHKGNTGHKLFLAPNPPEGALLTYWLGATPGDKDEVQITVTDASGDRRYIISQVETL